MRIRRPETRENNRNTNCKEYRNMKKKERADILKKTAALILISALLLLFVPNAYAYGAADAVESRGVYAKNCGVYAENRKIYIENEAELAALSDMTAAGDDMRDAFIYLTSEYVLEFSSLMLYVLS